MGPAVGDLFTTFLDRVTFPAVLLRRTVAMMLDTYQYIIYDLSSGFINQQVFPPISSESLCVRSINVLQQKRLSHLHLLRFLKTDFNLSANLASFVIVFVVV